MEVHCPLIEKPTSVRCFPGRLFIVSYCNEPIFESTATRLALLNVRDNGIVRIVKKTRKLSRSKPLTSKGTVKDHFECHGRCAPQIYILACLEFSFACTRGNFCQLSARFESVRQEHAKKTAKFAQKNAHRISISFVPPQMSSGLLVVTLAGLGQLVKRIC